MAQIWQPFSASNIFMQAVYSFLSIKLFKQDTINLRRHTYIVSYASYLLIGKSEVKKSFLNIYPMFIHYMLTRYLHPVFLILNVRNLRWQKWFIFMFRYSCSVGEIIDIVFVDLKDACFTWKCLIPVYQTHFDRFLKSTYTS